MITDVQPETVQEVRSAIERWCSSIDQNFKSWLSFILHINAALKVSIKRSAPDVKVQIADRCLYFMCGRQRLNLNLEKFFVRSDLESQAWHFDINHDPQLERRFLRSVLQKFAETRHPAFYTRFLRAVRSLETDLSDALIAEATAAPTDHLVVLQALSSVPWATELAEEDPIVAAQIRGLHKRQEMVKAGGGVLTAEQAAKVLGLTRQAVDKRRSSNQLLALTQGRRGYSYPGFQFDGSNTLSGLEKVLEAMSALDPWMQLGFFTAPNERLNGKTPIKALRNGKVDETVKVASTYGEQGAL